MKCWRISVGNFFPYFVCIVIVVIAGFLVKWAINNFSYQIKEEKKFIVPIYPFIEEAIEVRAARNVIVVTESMGLGGGVGVGMGAPEIQCKTIEQFLDLIPENAKIYTSIERKSSRTLLKRYLAFMENKPGVIFYERIIKIELFDPRQIKIVNPDYKYMHGAVSVSFTDTEIIYSYILYYKYKLKGEK